VCVRLGGSATRSHSAGRFSTSARGATGTLTPPHPPPLPTAVLRHTQLIGAASQAVANMQRVVAQARGGSALASASAVSQVMTIMGLAVVCDAPNRQHIRPCLAYSALALQTGACSWLLVVGSEWVGAGPRQATVSPDPPSSPWGPGRGRSGQQKWPAVVTSGSGQQKWPAGRRSASSVVATPPIRTHSTRAHTAYNEVTPASIYNPNLSLRHDRKPPRK
jgi:hypothetical protein